MACHQNPIKQVGSILHEVCGQVAQDRMALAAGFTFARKKRISFSVCVLQRVAGADYLV